jgi:hypothetical protein
VSSGLDIGRNRLPAAIRIASNTVDLGQQSHKLNAIPMAWWRS